jgi:hypothetical protein
MQEWEKVGFWLPNIYLSKKIEEHFSHTYTLWENLKKSLYHASLSVTCCSSEVLFNVQIWRNVRSYFSLFDALFRNI